MSLGKNVLTKSTFRFRTNIDGDYQSIRRGRLI